MQINRIGFRFIKFILGGLLLLAISGTGFLLYPYLLSAQGGQPRIILDVRRNDFTTNRGGRVEALFNNTWSSGATAGGDNIRQTRLMFSPEVNGSKQDFRISLEKFSDTGCGLSQGTLTTRWASESILDASIPDSPWGSMLKPYQTLPFSGNGSFKCVKVKVETRSWPAGLNDQRIQYVVTQAPSDSLSPCEVYYAHSSGQAIPPSWRDESGYQPYYKGGDSDTRCLRLLLGVRLEKDPYATPPNFQMSLEPRFAQVVQGGTAIYALKIYNCQGGVTQVVPGPLLSQNGILFNFVDSAVSCGGQTSLVARAQISPPDVVTASPGITNLLITAKSNWVNGRQAQSETTGQLEVVAQPKVSLVGESTDNNGKSISGTGLSILAGKSVTLKWSPTYTTPGTNCTASGNWSGARVSDPNKTHMEVVGPLNSGQYVYKIQCLGPGGTSNLATVNVSVSSEPVGTIKVQYTQNGVVQSQPLVNAIFEIRGPSVVTENTYSITRDFTGLKPGSYTFRFVSASPPPGFTFASSNFVTPGLTQNLASNSNIVYTLNFVSLPTLSRVSLTPKNTRLKVGDTQSYTLTAYYSDHTGREVSNQDVTALPGASYSVSDMTVASIGLSPDPKNILRAKKPSLTTGIIVTGQFEQGSGVNRVVKTDTAQVFVDALPRVLLSCPVSVPPVQKGGIVRFNVRTNQPILVKAELLSLPGLNSASGFGAFIPPNWPGKNINLLPPSFDFISGTQNASIGSYRFLVTATSGETCFSDFVIIDEIEQVDINPKNPSIVVYPGNPHITQPPFTLAVRYKSSPPGVFIQLPGSQVSWQSSGVNIAQSQGSGLFKGLAPGQVNITGTFQGKNASTTLTVMDFSPQCLDKQTNKDCNLNFSPKDTNRDLILRLSRLPLAKPFDFGNVCLEVYIIDKQTGATYLGGANACGGNRNNSIFFQGTWEKSKNYGDLAVSLPINRLPANRNYTLALNAYGSGLTHISSYNFSIGGNPSTYDVARDPEVHYVMQDNGMDSLNVVDYKLTVTNCQNMPANQTFTFSDPDLRWVSNFESPQFLTPKTVGCGGSVVFRLKAKSNAGPISVTNNPPQRPISLNVTSAGLADKSVAVSIFIYGRPKITQFDASNYKPLAGQTIRMTWQTENVLPGNHCEASNTWNGLKPEKSISGEPIALNLAGQFTYTLRCRSQGSGKFANVWSAPRSVIVDVGVARPVAPATPILNAPAVSCTGITLTWTQPRSASPIAHYQLYRDGQPVGGLIDGSSRQTEDTTVVAGAFYTYTIRAISTNGVSSLDSNTQRVGFTGCEAKMDGSNKQVFSVKNLLNPGADSNNCDKSGTLVDSNIKPRVGQSIKFLINLCNKSNSSIVLGSPANRHMVITDTDLTRLTKPVSGWNVVLTRSGQDITCPLAPAWSNSVPACQHRNSGQGFEVRLKDGTLPASNGTNHGLWKLKFDAVITLNPQDNGDVFYYRNRAVVTYPKTVRGNGSIVLDTGFLPLFRIEGENIELEEIAPGE